jgi:predicted nucleic acid-binding protein
VILYLDTSALVKLFVEEADSDVVREARVRASGVCSSRLAWAEAVATFARAKRERRITQEDFYRLVESLDAYWQGFSVIEVTQDLLNGIPLLVLAHPLRTVDAIHLASAKVQSQRCDDQVLFAAFDESLARAAHKLGFEVVTRPGRPLRNR